VGEAFPTGTALTRQSALKRKLSSDYWQKQGWDSVPLHHSFARAKRECNDWRYEACSVYLCWYKDFWSCWCKFFA